MNRKLLTAIVAALILVPAMVYGVTEFAVFAPGNLVGGQADATPDTATDGTPYALKLDTKKNLKVTLVGFNSTTGVSSSSPLSVTITGNTYSTPAYTATAASAKPTYRADFSGVVGAGSGNLVEIAWVSGTVKILAIHFAKPSATSTLVIRKQSAASTGGTSANTTIVPLDSGFSAATATVKQFTAVPTAGTLVGNVYKNTIATTDTLLEEFGPRSGAPIVLRSAGQSVAINVDVACTPGGGYIEWTEE